MIQYLKNFAENQMKITILQTIEAKLLKEQLKSENELEAKNLNAAELIRAKVEELKVLDQRVLQSEEVLKQLNAAKESVDLQLMVSPPEHRLEAYLELMKRGGKPDINEIILDSAKLMRLQDAAQFWQIQELLLENQLQQAIAEIKALERPELEGLIVKIESVVLAEELNRGLVDALRNHYVKQMTYGTGRNGLARQQRTFVNQP